MTTLGITLLVVGVIIFAISFFIPDKAEKQTKKEKEKQEEEIRRMLERELDSMKLRVNEATNETVEYGMDKCERSLEKVSNEKIMAVSEYSATIMDEMDKKHKEIMFLYDMLNNKQTDIKNTVRKAEATAKEVSDAAKEASQQVEVMQNQAESIQEQINEQAIQQSKQPESTFIPRNELPNLMASEPVQYHGQIDESIFENMDMPVINTPAAEPVFNRALAEGFDETFETSVPFTSFERPEMVSEPEINADDYREASFTGTNNNERILAMHAQGMPVVDIAKELNLGVGEVKLVIDLYN